MNQKTARLLRRFSASIDAPPSLWKKLWNATPRNNRGHLRALLIDRMAVANQLPKKS